VYSTVSCATISECCYGCRSCTPAWFESERVLRFAFRGLQTEKGSLCRRELGLVDDRRWEMFTSKQARMNADKKRLATTRIQPDSDLAKAFAEASGQNVNTVQPSQ
jgi:hypothetical protein